MPRQKKRKKECCTVVHLPNPSLQTNLSEERTAKCTKYVERQKRKYYKGDVTGVPRGFSRRRALTLAAGPRKREREEEKAFMKCVPR